jgi:hypothetical protein
MFYMSKQFVWEAFGWGFILWLIGYVLGIVLFMFVPTAMVGWIIMPIGTLITLWVLFKKIRGKSLKYFLMIALVWAVLAIVLDYFFLVKLFKPADGYYKLDVYLYYFLIFVLPIAVGFAKGRRK